MSLEEKSKELKEIVATYNTQWFLGDLSGVMIYIASGKAQDQLRNLSSPARQLYFLAGLLLSSDPIKGKSMAYELDFVNYLFLREELHGRLICMDELEVCGAYLAGKLAGAMKKQGVIATTPDLAAVFDEQYFKGMGFSNEKYLAEKKSGKIITI